MRAGLVASIVLLAGARALAGDVIFLADGRTLGATKASDPPTAADLAASNVSVVEENLDGVVYRVAGIPTRQTLARAQVREVVHDPATAPPELAEGLALLAKGKFDDARAKLAAVAHNPVAPVWAQAEAAFRSAASHAAGGDASGAEKSLAAFSQERPRSRFVADAKRLRARVLVDLDRADEAKAEYEAIGKLPGATDDEVLDSRFWSAWTDAVRALRADDAKAAAAAARVFQELRGAAASRPLVQARCDVGRAASGDVPQTLASLVDGADDPFVLAVGNAILADAARRRGAASKDRAALDEAHERYLRVALLYRDAEGAADFTAASQFHAGELFLELAPTDAAGEAEAKSRARREWDELVRRFPRSSWARKARAAIAAL